MIIKCENCLKIFNFKTENLPDKAFSFHCTQCDEKIWVTQEEIVDALSKARQQSKKEEGGKNRRKSLPTVDPAKLKKPVMKLVSVISKISGRSEQYWLFSLTKLAAVVSIAALILIVVIGGLAYFSLNGNTEVTYAELERSLFLKKDPTLNIQSAVPGIVLPERVKKHIDNDHREDFVDWINGLEDHQKADFVANLDQIIGQAQKKDPGHINDFINEYQKHKFNRSVQKPFLPYLIQIGIIVMVFTAVVLLGLFCLILLQLTWQKTVFASERPEAAAPAAPAPMGRSSLRKRAV